jgi:DNA-binding NarL/FixJ family response regulator
VPTKEKLLLIEDSEDYLVFLRVMLAPFFDLDEAVTLADGVAKLKQLSNDGQVWRTDYFAVLLDLGLPDSDARTTFPALAKQIPTAAVIIISQHDDSLFVANMIRWGAAGYLVRGKDDIDGPHLNRVIRNAARHESIQAGLDESTRIIKQTDTELHRM